MNPSQSLAKSVVAVSVVVVAAVVTVVVAAMVIVARVVNLAGNRRYPICNKKEGSKKLSFLFAMYCLS
jgi:hypothetical protein